MSGRGGQEYFFYLLNYGLSALDGFEITIITPGYNPLLEKLKERNIKILYINFNNPNFFRSFKRFKSFISENKFDLIHTHDLLSNLFVYLTFKNKKNIINSVSSRYFVLMSMFMPFKTRFIKHIISYLEKKLFLFNDFNICPTKNIMSDYLHLGVPPSKTSVIYPGLDYDNTLTNAEEKEKIRKKIIGAESKKIKIVCLFGSFDRLRNGYDVYMKIVEEFKTKYPDSPVKFAVYGEQSEQLQIYLNQKNVAEDIAVVENYYSPNDVIQAIDIMALPYRYCAFPLPLLKAQKFYKPVVASETGIIPEIIYDGINGYLLPVADYVSFAEKIKNLAENEELYKTMTENIKKSFKEFKLEDMISKHSDIYRRLIELSN
ncbi:MAG TPA: glycosyltransferase family 4 protein [bacterium]|nr:glycosyltransferase family 4 protein [bacterium]